MASGFVPAQPAFLACFPILFRFSVASGSVASILACFPVLFRFCGSRFCGYSDFAVPVLGTVVLEVSGSYHGFDYNCPY